MMDLDLLFTSKWFYNTGCCYGWLKHNNIVISTGLIASAVEGKKVD